MVNIRNTNQIISSLIDFYKLVEPELDTKTGTVIRDLVISPLSSQLSLLYDEVASLSSKQSLLSIIGSDIDKFARNFGLSRKKATATSGVAVLTFKSVDGNIAINKGDLVFSSNGISYSIVSSNRIISTNSNYYRSIATKYKSDFDLLGITDIYAIEVPVLCSIPGTSGNISKYSLSRVSIPGISNITNVVAFSGGTDVESDAIFKNRILAKFSGSSVGTNLGYFNSAASVDNVLDVYVAEPNDPLMTRDGTIVTKSTDGILSIVKEGSGGKVDVFVLGSNLIEASDSFIYNDKSNKLDATDSKNDYIIGQILSDSNKTIQRKRFDNIKQGILPTQPVRSIVEVSGSLSGSNFKEKSIDSNGIVSGNYELVKDSGYYANSPWGFDIFKWISNKISNFQEEKIKSQSRNQDTLTYTDVSKISKIEQSVLITNENSKVTSDRSIIQLLHYPCTSVTKVFNTNTGERYFVTNQNVDGSSNINTTGRIKISGSTLPSASDILQVDYTWIVDYDPNIDFDGLNNTSNLRTVDDSVDWSYSCLVKDEKIKLIKDATGTFYSGSTTLPILNVLNCFEYKQLNGVVSKITDGKYIDRLSINIQNLTYYIDSVDSIKLDKQNYDVFKTTANDGLYTITTNLYLGNIVYNLYIILPSDTLAVEGDNVNIFANYSDVFTKNTLIGSSSNRLVSVPAGNVSSTSEYIYAFVSYITSSNTIYSGNIGNLPSSKLGNGFQNSFAGGSQNKILSNNIKVENAIVQLNSDSDLYVELSLSNDNFIITSDDIVSISISSSGKEYWNKYNQGSIINSDSGKYQLILSGFNSPNQGDRVCISYYFNELNRIQNLNYSNELINYSNAQIAYDGSNYYVPIFNFINSSGFSFSVMESSDGYSIYSANDGVMTSYDGYAILSSSSSDFSTLYPIENFIVNIEDGYSANIYEIVEYIDSNSVKIGFIDQYLNKDNFFSYLLNSSKELTISNIENNKIILSGSYNIGDWVISGRYNYNKLRSAASRLLLNINDNVINPGLVTISGATIIKATDVLFTNTSSDLIIDLSEAVSKNLGYSITSIPSNFKLVNVVSIEKVTESNNIVSLVNYTFDLKNSELKNYIYFDYISNQQINNFQIKLNQNSFNTSGDLKVGDKLRATFYIMNDSDSESISFSRNGIQYTNKKFMYLNKISYSGFKNSQSTRILCSLFNEPNTSSRYKVTYDYVAPKQNERIIIKYNYNKLISDVTFAIEQSRPINADVLVKEASVIDVSINVLILINKSLGIDEKTIVQNVSNSITNFINTFELGRTIEESDIRLSSDNVNGVDRTRVISFNVSGNSGSVSRLISQNNEYFNLKELTINTEFR